MRACRSSSATLILVVLLWPAPSPAQEPTEHALSWFGDFRLRLEQDWDSLQSDGTERDDRLRMRIRLRGGLQYAFNDSWSATIQARSGPHDSQQSPHITIYDFDGGSDGPYEFNLDEWFLRYERGGAEFWVGRNTLSYLHQDDLFVFDNVTYAGAGGSYRHDFGQNALFVSANVVALPVGMRDFVGEAIVGQVAYNREFERAGFSVGLGYFISDADPDDPAGQLLLTENNTRDYQVWSLQLQLRTRAFERPLLLGLDLSHNAEDYADAPAGSFSEFHRNDVDGVVVQAVLGGKEPGDWQFGYFYADQEALTTHSSYVQDDWVRWGNANQVRATNLRGSELRVLYSASERLNVFGRLFFVDALELLEPGDTTKETGNRFRLDLNYSFD